MPVPAPLGMPEARALVHRLAQLEARLGVRKIHRHAPRPAEEAPQAAGRLARLETIVASRQERSR